uniref:NADH dehydrogenase subunit 4L n=3 Tax=Bombus terrestris TaxID=30195 RepID=A0A0N7J5P0_BOMTE|nr:NADH dehydrogenase subunit 4L [Bombus terrestris lusitanicus]YP_009709994.1 NADH dehydrogenase subunit 4L [Bombus terrestris terrestris]ALK48404.1 NADH dehydrogenase subunit 4L [Bombus terrestris]ALO64836.1 NADH dehydrogenase subunit 4L [Bombus terrestris]QFV14241.1 NADH dehydrogenase subunit 4L [Bombus terrestris lusitanicus]QFV14254.1 NADH dehydrogenase subunit 4L [Bombus terrestris terrestris]
MLDYLIFNMVFLMLIVLLNYSIYFLSFLIGIEYLIAMILFYLLLMDYNGFLYLIYLIYSVCESVLGLSLLVSMNYEYGHQKINFVNLI